MPAVLASRARRSRRAAWVCDVGFDLPLLQVASTSRCRRRSPTQCKAISLARPCTSGSATRPPACLLQIPSPSRGHRRALNQRSAISLAPPLEQRQHMAVDQASGHLLRMAPGPTSPPPQVCYTFFFFFFPSDVNAQVTVCAIASHCRLYIAL
jgi:hypothetical protein